MKPAFGKRYISLDWLKMLLPISVFLIWYFASTAFHVPEYIIPSPTKLLLVLIDFIIPNYNLKPYSGEFIKHSFASIGRVLGGFFIALSLGLPLGILTGRSILFNKLIDPSVNIIRTIPGIGWLPIAMVWYRKQNYNFFNFFSSFFPNLY